MRIIISIISVFIILVSSCRKSQDTENHTHEEFNAVYYWKTVYNPDSLERDFISKNEVGRIYLRMFDVTADEFSHDLETKTVPNATVKFPGNKILESFPMNNLEYVPVVYVTLDALKSMKGNEGVLASNIVKRVARMVSFHQLSGVSEIQLDCDWTVSTEESFFSLCDSVKCYIDSGQLDWDLSSTIRLHQLSRKVPPVDRGVLMVYNTGNFNDPDAENSIINVKDIEPYLKHLRSYPLHLDVAYPTYSWQLLFRKREFKGLLNGLDLNDSTRFSRRNGNSFVALTDFPFNHIVIHKGDVIRNETSSFTEIMKVKTLIENRLSGKPHSNILYHLDSANLNKYTYNEISTLYSANN